MTGYCITIAAGAGPEETAPAPDADVATAIGALVDQLSDLHGSVSGDHRGWSATITIDADNIDTARATATHQVLTRAEACNLPTTPVTRVEAVREDVRDAELDQPNAPELVSGPEVAGILGVNRQRVHQLAHTHPNFPKPMYRLGIGSLWDQQAIDEFARQWDRNPGRPAKPAS